MRVCLPLAFSQDAYKLTCSDVCSNFFVKFNVLHSLRSLVKGMSLRRSNAARDLLKVMDPGKSGDSDSDHTVSDKAWTDNIVISSPADSWTMFSSGILTNLFVLSSLATCHNAPNSLR